MAFVSIPGDRPPTPRHIGVPVAPARSRSPAAARSPIRAMRGSTCTPETGARLAAGGGRALVPTGIAIAIPPGHAAFVLPRSGLALRHGITVVNSPGLIDAAYRGEVKVVMLNTDPEADYEVHRGDRIAQLVVQRVESVVWQVVDRARRRGSRRRLRPLRPLTAFSTPGEDGLLEAGDRVGPALQRQPAELHQHGAGRGVDQVVAERHLHDRAVALGDVDEARRIIAAQLVQADPIRRQHLAGSGRRSRRPPPHSTTGVITKPDRVG